tara:strand:- start:41 stop:283 length:243 start_codon:yes stop_codon:yes gene_type:complete
MENGLYHKLTLNSNLLKKINTMTQLAALMTVVLKLPVGAQRLLKPEPKKKAEDQLNIEPTTNLMAILSPLKATSREKKRT